MKISEPKTKTEFEKYYELRWKILRKPWNQPKGSEKDDLENKSIHRMVCDNSGEIIGCGRLHFNTEKEAQIRYMAVEENYQGKDVGSQILKSLEKSAKKNGVKYIILNSRDIATKFYEKQGYRIVEKDQTLFGSIEHYRMRKQLQWK